MKSISTFLIKTKRVITICIWATGFMFRAMGWWALLQLVRQIYYSVNPIIFSFWFGQLINVLVQVYQNGITPESQQSLYTSIIWIGGLSVVSLVLGLNEGLYNAFNTQRALVTFFKVVYHHIAKLDWEQIEDPRVEKLIRSTLDQGFWPVNAFVRRIIALVITILTFGVALQLMDLPLLIIVIIVLTIIPKGIADFYFVIIDGKVYEKILPRLIGSNGIVNYFRNFSTLYEVKVWNFAPYLIERFVKERGSYEQTLRQDSKVYQWVNVLTSAVSFGGGLYVLYYLIKEVINKTLAVGSFQFYFTTLERVRSDILGLFGNIGELTDTYRYLGYTYDLLHLPTKHKNGTKSVSFDYPPEIEFRKVWFKYPRSRKWALKDVSVRIHSLERLALVGENGAGKSTFLRLLMRAYQPTKGEIFVNGIPLKELKIEEWYKLVALISQDFARFDMLQVQENIDLGDSEVDSHDDRIIEAASMAEAHEFVSKLPEKYQTVLSKRIEGGTELSTGQWQKVALSRLFFAKRQVVVLDEPTAAIDPIAEARIFKNVNSILKDKTVIIVSHRYNTVRTAHNILVFVDGTIIEQGTHEHLLKLKGYYARAFRLQQAKKSL